MLSFAKTWVGLAMVCIVGCGGSSFLPFDDSDASGAGSGGGGESGTSTGGSGTSSTTTGFGTTTGTSTGTATTGGGTSGSGGGGAGGGSGGMGGSIGLDAGPTCAPLAGCMSKTSCSDGCSSCFCSGGQWACTANACIVDAGKTDAGKVDAARLDATAADAKTTVDASVDASVDAAMDAAVADATVADVNHPDAATGSCQTDSDCIFRSQSGCCGMCLAVSDPIPPPALCLVACIAKPAGCLCINNKCAGGTLPLHDTCDTSHDLCGAGLKCCSQCAIPGDSGASCHVCTQTVSAGSGDICPLIP